MKLVPKFSSTKADLFDIRKILNYLFCQWIHCCRKSLIRLKRIGWQRGQSRSKIKKSYFFLFLYLWKMKVCLDIWYEERNNWNILQHYAWNKIVLWLFQLIFK
jgi:hypothetical protein